MSFIRKIKRNGNVYLAEVENKRIDGKCVQRHVRYIGKEVDGKTKLSASISDIQIDEVKLYGPLLVLHHLATEIDLPNLLGKYSNEILSLVYAHCLNYKSINKMSQWFSRTDLSFMLNIGDVTEKRLLTALDHLEQSDCEGLQRALFNNVVKKIPVKKKGLVYDVTNTYLYGKQCPLAKRGHDKEGVKGRKLIQIGLAVTQEKGIPLFHKVFDGNIHDAKTLTDLMSTMKTYRISDGLLVYDRGIASADNIRETGALGWNTLCGLSLHNNLKKIIRALNEKDIINFDNRVQSNKTIFYVKSIPHEIDSVSGTLAICFNDNKKIALRESRYDEIREAQKLLAKNKKIKTGMEKLLNINGSINRKALLEAEEFDGYSCIFATCPMRKENMVRLYFDKDVVEKAFHSLKGITQLRPIRHWLYNRVLAHVIICYLSYTLLAVLKHYMEPLKMSPVTALHHLDTMHKIYMRDKKKEFKINRIVTLTKIQKDILRAVNPGLLKV